MAVADPPPPDPNHPDEEASGLVCDFVGGALGHRLRQGFGRNQPLGRAVGLKPSYSPVLVDATAGLGRDTILLASLGVPVIAIERSPEMHARLAEGLRRARVAGGAAGVAAARVTLLLGDARDLLPGLIPDVVLVDPMHPARTKTALVKLAMRQVRELVGTDPDGLDLMKVALGAARRRVVLKWPLRAAAMAGLPPPHHAITTKTLRLDVFLTGAAG